MIKFFIFKSNYFRIKSQKMLKTLYQPKILLKNGEIFSSKILSNLLNLKIHDRNTFKKLITYVRGKIYRKVRYYMQFLGI